MTESRGPVTQALEIGRTAIESFVSVLSIDWFWSVWLASVIGVEIAITKMIPSVVGSGSSAIAVYLCGAGLTSALYATSYELIARRDIDRPATRRKVRARRSPPPPGETMIPGAIGLALATLGAFLFIALARNDMVILLAGLPVVVITAPLFSLFAFGYTRGEPTIGSFAYRKMPWGLVPFLAIAGFVVVARSLHWMEGDGAVLVSSVVIPAAIVALAFNLYRNWSSRKKAARTH
jgi:4-hydroxybenzoate polyprenyltransferase